MTNTNGWDDEAAAMKAPDLYRCVCCGGAFFKFQTVAIRIPYGNEGCAEVRYCKDCMKNLKPEGCPLVAYDDPAQWVYLCVNCPIPELICDLRSNAPIKVVKKE